jgi:hypothetical protein
MVSEGYVGETMKNSNVFEWHKRFKVGREDVEDDERCGRPKSHRTGEHKCGTDTFK